LTNTAIYARLKLRRHVLGRERVGLGIGYVVVVVLAVLLVVTALNRSGSSGATAGQLATAPTPGQAGLKTLALAQIPVLDRLFPASVARPAIAALAKRAAPAPVTSTVRPAASPTAVVARPPAIARPHPRQSVNVVARTSPASNPSSGTQVKQVAVGRNSTPASGGGAQKPAGHHSGLASGGG
jgi:hypothetical protein